MVDNDIDGDEAMKNLDNLTDKIFQQDNEQDEADEDISEEESDDE